VQIEEGRLRPNYKITTFKKHLKMEKINKKKFLNRLGELSVEALTLRHQHDI
jgi:hypothetical protein